VTALYAADGASPVRLPGRLRRQREEGRDDARVASGIGSTLVGLGGVVWLGLNFFRVRNPFEEMTVWEAVLAASLAMPLLVHLLAPLVAPWRR
jgi:hypothetical protein